jgi:transmembrane sensor
MKDFRNYDITDFVIDEDFICWVHDKSHSDNLFWNNWLMQNPSGHLILAEARKVVESIKLEQRDIEPREVKKEIEKLLKTIRAQEKKNKPMPRIGFFHRNGWRAAAAIFLLGVAGILFFPSKRENINRLEKFEYARVVAASSSFTERANGDDRTIAVVLPDGSTVELGAKSRISYPNDFSTNASRDVYLSGEAFFKIARDPGHPFRVFTNEIVTKVLGTSFSVRCYEKDTTISVTVRTGKVSVCSQVNASDRGPILAVKPAGIIVTPNQQLMYQRSDQKFQKVLVGTPLFIVPDPTATDHAMAYEDKPVEDVFDQIGKFYGINIVYDNDLLSKCTVTADLSNEPFYRKLDLICKAIDAKYELLDGQVVIQSNGCQ